MATEQSFTSAVWDASQVPMNGMPVVRQPDSARSLSNSLENCLRNTGRERCRRLMLRGCRTWGPILRVS